jgi:hypothetical protein
MEAAGTKLRIFVDADACPVKDEVYRVAARYGLTVFVVANSPIVVPRAPEIERVVVGPARTPRTTGSPSGWAQAQSSSRRTFRWQAAA